MGSTEHKSDFFSRVYRSLGLKKFVEAGRRNEMGAAER